MDWNLVFVVMWLAPFPIILVAGFVGAWVMTWPSEIQPEGALRYAVGWTVLPAYCCCLFAILVIRVFSAPMLLMLLVGLPIATLLVITAIMYASRLGRRCVWWDERGVSGYRSIWRTKPITLLWSEIDRAEVPPFQGPRPDPERYNLDSRVRVHYRAKVFNDQRGLKIDFSQAANLNQLSEELCRRRPDLFVGYFRYNQSS